MNNVKSDFKDNKPLYVQIGDSIINYIKVGKLGHGDKIPSINQFSEKHLLSRDTVEKAYKNLMRKGIIRSVRGKGYYINRVDVQKNLKVLVIFNKLSNYKKQIFNSIIQTLGPEATIDLSIHHSNADILHNIICNNEDMYDYYIIAFHFYTDLEKAIQSVRQLPKNKVILLDKNLPGERSDYIAVYQDYEKDIFNALEDGIHLLNKYKKLYLCLPPLSNYPQEIAKGFRLFCISKCYEHAIIWGIEPFQKINPDEAFILIEETDLANLIKICKQTGLKVGTDVGIISYNDTPLKEILLDGITVISTDHELMGKTAASLILKSELKCIKNPFTLIIRNSL